MRLHVAPSRGNEQDGYRPVLVTSNAVVNDFNGRTSAMREWATEIPIKSLTRPGVALFDRIRSWGFTAREINFRGETVTAEELDAAKYAIRYFLQL